MVFPHKNTAVSLLWKDQITSVEKKANTKETQDICLVSVKGTQFIKELRSLLTGSKTADFKGKNEAFFHIVFGNTKVRVHETA